MLDKIYDWLIKILTLILLLIGVGVAAIALGVLINGVWALEYHLPNDDSVDVDVVHAVHAASYGGVYLTAFHACVASARFESVKVFLDSVRSTVAPARRAKALRAVRRIQSRRLVVGVAVESAWSKTCKKLEKKQEIQLRQLLGRTCTQP